MRVLKVRGWHLAVLGLAILALLTLGAADGPWWSRIFLGLPLPLTPLTVTELPLPLVEAYSRARWQEGVDAYLDPESGDLYVLLRWGQKPTGGYRVVPEEARLLKRRGRCEIRVRARYVTPDPGQPVIEVATFPAAGMRLRVEGLSVTGCTVKAYDQYRKAHGSSAPIESERR